MYVMTRSFQWMKQVRKAQPNFKSSTSSRSCLNTATSTTADTNADITTIACLYFATAETCAGSLHTD